MSTEILIGRIDAITHDMRRLIEERTAGAVFSNPDITRMGRWRAELIRIRGDLAKQLLEQDDSGRLERWGIAAEDERIIRELDEDSSE